MTLSKTIRGYYFPIVNLLGYISVTKLRVHSFIDAENLRRTTLHRKKKHKQQISTETCCWVPMINA